MCHEVVEVSYVCLVSQQVPEALFDLQGDHSWKILFHGNIGNTRVDIEDIRQPRIHVAGRSAAASLCSRGPQRA